MSYMDEFNFWLNDDYFDQATKDELLAIRNNEGEIEERFYKELEFGTGGLRGVIEYLYSQKGIPGSCQLYYQGKRTEEGHCNCI